MDSCSQVNYLYGSDFRSRLCLKQNNLSFIMLRKKMNAQVVQLLTLVWHQAYVILGHESSCSSLAISCLFILFKTIENSCILSVGTVIKQVFCYGIK
jgi:hypothetical protein